jgi:diadenylate cyclase
MNILGLFQLQWSDLVDIGILSLVIYYLILLLQGTKSFQIMLGVVALLSLYYVSILLELRSILWVFQNILQYTVILLVIIFQADIRNALANFGRTGVLKREAEYKKYLRRVMKSVQVCHKKKNGLIIAFEKKINLGEYIKTGVELQAEVTSPLILSIFSKNAPLHDGAVVISSNRIAAASCIFPLSNRVDLNPNYGTRHRAAVGLTEITDAAVITVSEETGKISVFFRGEIYNGVSVKKAQEILNNYLKDGKREE